MDAESPFSRARCPEWELYHVCCCWGVKREMGILDLSFLKSLIFRVGIRRCKVLL